MLPQGKPHPGITLQKPEQAVKKSVIIQKVPVE